MRLIVLLPRPILLVMGLAVISRPGWAGSNLLDNSPFLPPNALAGAAQEAAPLELRSIFKAGSDYQFSLYEMGKRQSIWVGLNEPDHDFLVKAFDSANDTITVEQHGRTYKLTLKEARIALLNTVAAMPPPGGVAGAPFPPPGTAVGAGAPYPGPGMTGGVRAPVPTLTPDQLRNLEADINRRRELRRRAMAAPTAPPPASPAPAGQPR
jgi:hypothetical protein